MIKVKVKNEGWQLLPEYKTPQSSGMDLRANIRQDVVLKPMERRLIPTGLHVALPDGYEAQVRSRSGMALKYGVTVLNSPGTVDSDYRGEICVLLVNLSNEPYTVHEGDRIAQLVIVRYEQAEWIAADVLDDTDRGQGGFGSTGK